MWLYAVIHHFAIITQTLRFSAKKYTIWNHQKWCNLFYYIPPIKKFNWYGIQTIVVVALRSALSGFLQNLSHFPSLTFFNGFLDYNKVIYNSVYCSLLFLATVNDNFCWFHSPRSNQFNRSLSFKFTFVWYHRCHISCIRTKLLALKNFNWPVNVLLYLAMLKNA